MNMLTGVVEREPDSRVCIVTASTYTRSFGIWWKLEERMTCLPWKISDIIASRIPYHGRQTEFTALVTLGMPHPVTVTGLPEPEPLPPPPPESATALAKAAGAACGTAWPGIPKRPRAKTTRPNIGESRSGNLIVQLVERRPGRRSLKCQDLGETVISIPILYCVSGGD
jgi:hypothetical protein